MVLRFSWWSWLAIAFVLLLGMGLTMALETASASPSVRIHADPVDLQNMFYIHPGANESMCFTVENRGDLPDSYEVNVTLTHPHFRACLDRNSTGTVAPGEGFPMTLTLWAVPGAKEGDRTFVNITAVSPSMGVNSSLTFNSFLIVIRKVEVSSRDAVRAVGVGQTARFLIDVTNVGDVNDTYAVEAQVTWGDDGWVVALSTTRLGLDPLCSEEFALNVTSPTDAVDNATVSVKVTSLSQPSVSDGCILRCLMTVRWSANISTEAAELSVEPGSVTCARVLLRQDSDDPRGDEWNVTPAGSDESWEVIASPVAFVLVGIDDATVDIDVTAPQRTPPGVVATVWIVAVCARYPDQRFELNLTFRTTEVHNLSIVAPPSGFGVVPAGESRASELSVRNDGNVAEACVLDVEVPVCVRVGSRIGLAEGGAFTVPPWETVTMELVLKVDDDPSVIGPFLSGALRVRAEGLTLGPVPLSFGIVDPRWPLQLERLDDRVRSVEPGDHDVRIPFHIRNALNVSFEGVLDATTSNPRCQITLVNGTLSMGPHAEAFAEVYLTVGDDAAFGSFWIEVKDPDLTEPPSAPSHALRLPFDVVGPDLQVLSVELERPARVGEDVVFIVTVADVGRGPSGPTTIQGSVEGGKAPPRVYDLGPFEPGTNRTVRFTFKAQEGNRSYVFEVDPGDLIREDGNASNAYTLNYEAGDVPPARGGLTYLVVALVALAVLILVAILVRARMVRRRGG